MSAKVDFLHNKVHQKSWPKKFKIKIHKSPTKCFIQKNDLTQHYSLNTDITQISPFFTYTQKSDVYCTLDHSARSPTVVPDHSVSLI